MASRSPFAIRPISTSSDVACITLGRSARKLVAGGCNWVHGSATEMAEPLTPPLAAPQAGDWALGPRIMADKRRWGAWESSILHNNSNSLRGHNRLCRIQRVRDGSNPILLFYPLGQDFAAYLIRTSLTLRSAFRRPGLPVPPEKTRQTERYVPTLSGEWSFRRAATTESAVIRPVLGFSEGIFSIARVNRAESLSTSMVWQLRSMVGSAQISIMVRSGPMPAIDSAAATLTLAGNPAAPSLAVPLNTRLGPLMPSSEMPLASR